MSTYMFFLLDMSYVFLVKSGKLVNNIVSLRKRVDGAHPPKFNREE